MELMNKKYTIRFNYYQVNSVYHRTTKTWWKIFYWFGSLNTIRYGVDRVINLFDKQKGKTLKERWNYWGGGGRINWLCRKYLTYD